MRYEKIDGVFAEITTWRELLEQAMKGNSESFSDIIFTTLTDAEMNQEFNRDFGQPFGCPFTAWTKDWVYFPLEYDGYEKVGSAPRDPCDIKMEHQGGIW